MGVLTCTCVLGVIPGHPVWGGRPTPLVAGTSAVITDTPPLLQMSAMGPPLLGCSVLLALTRLPATPHCLLSLTKMLPIPKHVLADAVTPQILTSAC